MQVFLVDLSDALLEMARERVAKLGLSASVTLIEGDVNEPSTLAKLPKGGADFVTCSYCLTMIPPWEQALKTMVGLTKEGGYLGLVDFTTKKRMGAWQSIYKWWFANDGVYFNRAHVDWLHSCDQLETVWYKEVSAAGLDAPRTAHTARRVPHTPRAPIGARHAVVRAAQRGAALGGLCGSAARVLTGPLLAMPSRAHCRALRAVGGPRAVYVPHAHALHLLRKEEGQGSQLTRRTCAAAPLPLLQAAACCCRPYTAGGAPQPAGRAPAEMPSGSQLRPAALFCLHVYLIPVLACLLCVSDCPSRLCASLRATCSAAHWRPPTFGSHTRPNSHPRWPLLDSIAWRVAARAASRPRCTQPEP